ncbi:response regulator [uncultured Algibacter sp.]|uniref:response regulator n=1 Tax=uncultured Algibacter sp. TaxID=298659 RepID=UPI003218095E
MSFRSAKKKLRVTTYSKVVLLLSVVSAGFILLFSALYYQNINHKKAFFSTSSEALEREINALMSLNNESYTNLINEITYWDELVDFIKNKDVRWFDNSLAYLVDTYKVDYLDAYSMDEEFVTKVSTTKISSKEFIPKDVFTKLKRDKLIKFYVKIDEGILIVHGATVHASEDPFKNKTQPQGYLFMAKLLDDKYFVNLENVSSSQISYITGRETLKKNEIHYVFDVKNIHNKNIASLLFKRQSKLDFTATEKILRTILFGFIGAILIFLYFANKWAKKPIKLIKEVLEKGNVHAINALKNTRGEFRYIGKLFEQNHHQKTELERTKLKAEESDKLKSAFLMNLSHEIRTPMNAILGFSDLTLKQDISEQERHRYLKIIQQSGKHLVDIIDHLVEMSKIDSAVIAPKYSSIDLHKIFYATFESIKATMDKSRDIDFKFMPPKTLLTKHVITDVIKINQIATNLLVNAVRYTNEGFVIFGYEINKDTQMIDFFIKDSGIGIPDNLHDKIFTRFNKIDFNSSDPNSSGLGLGLAISKAYAEMLGGKITLKSEVGVGSTFAVSVPLKIDEHTPNYIPKNEHIPLDLGNEEIILIAEDNNLNYLLISKLLKQFNFQIIRAKNGQEAVDICKENDEIDLILMDIKMPYLDGHSAFSKIREFNIKIPIIAHTAYSFPEEIEKIKETGFDGFISKPIDKNKLFNIVKKYMVKVS